MYRLFFLCSAMWLSQAAASDLLTKRGGVELSAEVVAKHIRSAPADVRPLLVDSPERLDGIIDSLLLQEQLLAEASRLDLRSRVEVQAAIEAATRELLSKFAVEEMLAGKIKPDFNTLARERYLTDSSIGVIKAGRRVRHLLVASALIGEELAKQRAAELLVRARDGGDFSALVMEYSDDPSKAENEGVFLVQEDSLLDPAFRAASLELTEKEQIVGPVETQFGFHLIELIEVLPEGRQPLKAIQADLVQSLRDEWLKEQRKMILEQLRSNPIEYNGPGIEALRREFGTSKQ